MYNCPFFNTHHAPVGAWASLTFGAPGVGLSIDLQEPNVKASGTLLVGMASADGIQSIGFANSPKASSLTAEGDEAQKAAMVRRMMAPYGIFEEAALSRTLTPSRDVFSAGNVTFTTHTPYDALPDPKDGPIPPIACLPGILMDVTVDNTGSDKPATAFFGLLYHNPKAVYAFEEDGLCGVRFRNEWAFAANATDTYLVRGLDAALHLCKGTPFVQQNGPSFLCTNVPAGEKKTLTLCWAVHAKEASNGARNTVYYYDRYFKNPLQAAHAILENAGALRSIGEKVDAELLREGQDPARAALFHQAVRAYYASTQLLEDEDNGVRWNVGEGAYIWRNTMDLCADHITWELRRNPWIVRCLMDEFIGDYMYTDRVTFPGKPGDYPGGVSFTHDMGCYFSYSTHGYSAYERPNETDRGFYFYMTTEELLNGIYCLAGYALQTGDAAWLESHKDLLPALMESLENRDAPTPEERNGVLKASTTRGGACGLESTTYDALDHSLLEAAGNLYVFIKTWCSLVLLRRCCQLVNDTATDARALAMLEKCRASVKLFRSEDRPWLKANAYKDIPGAVAAAAEPLAVPHMLGVLAEGDEPVLFAALREHSTACLQKGVCWDAVSGGLRLSSTSRNTWPSKGVLTAFAMENVLGLQLPEHMVEEIIGWAQKSARDCTISDQIHADTRDVVGAPYYPRIVTAALWL